MSRQGPHNLISLTNHTFKSCGHCWKVIECRGLINPANKKLTPKILPSIGLPNYYLLTIYETFLIN